MSESEQHWVIPPEPCLNPRCLHRPSPLCSACGKPAVTATRASAHCSFSWCDLCILTLLMMRNPDAPALTFIPLDGKPTQPKAKPRKRTPRKATSRTSCVITQDTLGPRPRRARKRAA